MGYMTEERRLIQETARAFAMKEVLPLANKLDPEKADMPGARSGLAVTARYAHNRGPQVGQLVDSA